MITVNCPHCGQEHILMPDEIDTLVRTGKVVITDCTCGMLFTVEQGDDCFFTK